MKFISAIVAAIAVGCLSTAALSQSTAVQWTTESGGNGHWYEGVVGSISWNNARIAAVASGGDLASIESIDEHVFLVSTILLKTPSLFELWWGPHIGGIQADGANEPSGGWSWVSGSNLDCSNGLCDMKNSNDDQNKLSYATNGVTFTFNDIGSDQVVNTPSYLVEWSADCNSDGIVDYGQILSGQIADANANNIPDCWDSQSWATVLEYAPNPAVVTVLNLLDANTVGGRATSENYSAEKAKVANEPAIWISAPRSYNNFRFTVDLSGAPPRRRKCEVLSIDLSELP